MSGRKQHFIQQHLSRGFAIDPSRRPAQVWVYRRGAEPFYTSTENYGAQRDFYSTPTDTTVDDTITEAESKRFNSFLDFARAAPADAQIDGHEAARFYQHLLFRSKTLREIFTEGLGQLFVHLSGQLLDKPRLKTFLTELFRRHPRALIKQVEKQLDREMTAPERALVALFIEKNIEVLVPQFLDEHWPLLERMLALFQKRIPELVATGHRNSLKKSFEDDSGKRETEMRGLRWHVCDVDGALVLGDSCAFAELQTGQFVPMADAKDEVRNLYLPISTSRILVGNSTGDRHQLDTKALNLAAIVCSYTSFCGSADSGELREWMTCIGESVMPMTPSEFQAMASESFEKLISEQLNLGPQ